MNKVLIVLLALISTFFTSCSGPADICIEGDYVIHIETGDEWLHNFSTFIKTAPQYVLWMEDSTGNYMGTLFLTRKAATEGWTFNKGNRRVEALPVWAHKRNIRDESNILYPSKEQPLTDGISGATPKSDSEIIIRPTESHSGFWLFMEVNQSTDFNDYWLKNAKRGEPNWTGGKEGSGQPSLIYSIWIDSEENGSQDLVLVGHGSPDGSNGQIYEDIGTITTALYIIESVKVSRIP